MAKKGSSRVPAAPTEQLVRKYLDKFQRDKRYAPADEGLTELLRKFPRNVELGEVAVKAASINALYTAGILGIFQVAKRVHRLNIDPELARHSTAIVDKIAAVRFKNKRRNVFSFATKYCSWHDRKNYPIYDRFVDRLLRAYRGKDNFMKFRNDELRRYAYFKRIVSTFRDHYGLQRFSFTELDKFLWLYGRHLYPKSY
jgi:hypothetical protein